MFNTRDLAITLNKHKGFARKAEAEKRLETLAADLSDHQENMVDYLIWTNSAGRFVPVWFPTATQTSFAMRAVDLSIIAFRR